LSNERGSDWGYFEEPNLSLISELQAPLLGIAANARVASSKLNSDDARIGQYLEAIEFSSQNLVRTIDILLRSRDALSGNLALELEPVHIGLRVEEAIARLAPLCRAQAQMFDFKPKKGLMVSANSDCLELVVYHILEQALRSSAPEEILSVDLKLSGQMARLSVKASGSRERATSFRAAIKKAFSSESNQRFGVNYSLIASAKLISVMGGGLNISQRKDGVSFNLSFPLSRQAELF
jgi:K+-sensing histidine kinase KdpD